MIETMLLVGIVVNLTTWPKTVDMVPIFCVINVMNMATNRNIVRVR